MLVLALFLSVSTFFCAREKPRRQPARPEIRTNLDFESHNFGSLEVVGIDADLLNALRNENLSLAEWQRMFPAYTTTELPVEGTKPAILGTYSVEGGLIRFTPRFPFVKGMSYSARFDPGLLHSLTNLPPGKLTPVSHMTFMLPKPDVIASTRVAEIYPTTDELPENQLKFYIHFSAPMSRGCAKESIRLLDFAGREVEAPFLELEQELWDPETQRLTLFFHPGRIKRGLMPHKDLGLALKTGEKYTLQVSRRFEDAGGNPLVETFRKEFRVVSADRTSPDYKAWQLIPPTAGSVEPLTLLFREPLENALLGRMLVVKNAAEATIQGGVRVLNHETTWQFIPHEKWSSGKFIIHVDPALEDLAGNKLNRVFDVDLQKDSDTRSTPESILLQFAVSQLLSN